MVTADLNAEVSDAVDLLPGYKICSRVVRNKGTDQFIAGPNLKTAQVSSELIVIVSRISGWEVLARHWMGLGRGTESRASGDLCDYSRLRGWFSQITDSI